MLVCDKAYVEIKNKYILPLTEYSVKYQSLKNNNIKHILIDKFVSVEQQSDKTLVFRFEQDVLLKALVGEIQLFYVRYLMQKKDSEEIGKKNVSANWNIVSFYYRFFFASSLLLRLCYRGNLFLDSELKRKLERLVAHNLGTAISIESNQYYEIVKDNDTDEFVLHLKNMVATNTHELAWKKLDELMDEMYILTREKSDERALLSAIKKNNNRLSNTYPSKIRNKVNYQPLYGIEYLDNKLYSVDISISWLDYLLMGNANWENENTVVNEMFSYMQYIELLCNNLIGEYYVIRGNQNGLIKKINQKYTEKVSMESIKYTI